VISKKCSFCTKLIFRRSFDKQFKNVFCNLKCHRAWRKKIQIENNVELFKKGKLVIRPVIRRTMIQMGIPYQCSICGISIWQNKPLPMILDHINGNASNNLPNNFRFLCSNCESQTEHYKGKNRGNGRKSLGLI
jgi:5-methylcytosine-specific restriction endonuclease McrA